MICESSISISVLWDDPEVVEFASLVSRASQIRALGQ
jgi:hypothetical protein